MPRPRKSKPAFWVAGIFLLAAACVYGFHTVSVYTNPANSGDSGILLFPFPLPWILLLPDSVLRAEFLEHAALPGWWLPVLVNTPIPYAISGGFR